MKIAVPSMDDAGMQSPVSAHFGQAPYFTIVDSSTGEAVGHKSGGHSDGKTPAQHLSELDVDVVVGSAMGGRAMELLGNLGMEVFLEAEGTVTDAVEAFRQGKLPAASQAAPCTDPCPPRDE